MTKTKKTFGLITLFLSLLSLNTKAQEAIDFMTFNIWQEGTSVPNGVNKIRDVIIETTPDIICFTEVRNYNNQDWTTTIVNKLSVLGYTYYSSYIGGDVSILSKYPIINSSLVYDGQGSVAMFKIQLASQTIHVGCAHLDYTYYATYLPRGYNGGSPNWNMINDGTGNPSPVLDANQILSYNLQSARDEQISAFLTAVSNISTPVVLMGDFNEPSHLDWTTNSGQLFDHNNLTIPWQNTLTLQNNGFVDSYRKYFPNPVNNPGITWPSYAHQTGSTSWTPLADERDRIDYIFYKGSNISTLYSSLIGPKESYANNQITTSNTYYENFMANNLLWPSDHKAVYSTLYFGPTANANYSLNNIDNSSEKTINIYPNPVNEILQIEGVLIENDDDVNIFNTLGLEVSNFRVIDENKIDFSKLPKGMYILKVKNFINKVYKQ